MLLYTIKMMMILDTIDHDDDDYDDHDVIKSSNKELVDI